MRTFSHAKDVPDEVSKLCLQGDSKRIDRPSTDILPVEADRKESEPFVTVGATEYTCKIRRGRIGKAKDRKPCKQREYPFGKDLPEEYPVLL